MATSTTMTKLKLCEDCESQYTNLSIAHKSKFFLKIKPKINDFNGKISPNFDSKNTISTFNQYKGLIIHRKKMAQIQRKIPKITRL
jgi:hypothetical protein